MFSSRHGLPSAWIIFALPRYFPKEQSCQWVTEFADLTTNTAISLDLRVLLAFPEAHWSYLLKILLMRDAYLTGIIMRHLMQHLPSSENFKNVAKHSFTSAEGAPLKCEAFLCRGECFNVTESIAGDIGIGCMKVVLRMPPIKLFIICRSRWTVQLSDCALPDVPNCRCG